MTGEGRGKGPGQVSSDGVCGLHSQGGMICLDLSKVTGLLCKGFQGGKRNTRGGGWSLTRILSQPKKADRAGRQRLAASSGPWAMRPRLAWGPVTADTQRGLCGFRAGTTRCTEHLLLASGRGWVSSC